MYIVHCLHESRVKEFFFFTCRYQFVLQLIFVQSIMFQAILDNFKHMLGCSVFDFMYNVWML